MHVAYAIVFVGLVAFFETVRHGVFGLTASETIGTIYGALALAAVLLLRSDVVYILYRPRHALYGDAGLNWTWARTGLGVFLGPLLWIVPAAYGVALIQLNVAPSITTAMMQTALIQMALVGVAEGLFFREAVIKAFAGNRAQIYTVSALAVFVFYFPGGVPQALIATGAAIYFLTLRLIGANVLVGAALQGATVVVFSQMLNLGLTQAEMWPYAAYFLAAATALSLLIFALFSTQRGNPVYA